VTEMSDRRLTGRLRWLTLAGLLWVLVCVPFLAACNRPPEVLAALAHPTPFATAAPIAAATGDADPTPSSTPGPLDGRAPSPSAIATATGTQAATSIPTASRTLQTGTVEPLAGGRAALTPEHSDAWVNPYIIGGVDLTDSESQVLLSYPQNFEGSGLVTIPNIDILVSDEDGQNLAYFMDIAAWLGAHKVFVYPDTASGRPIVSVHDGHYAGVPLEGEPLRHLIEGPVYTPYASEVIQENLTRLVGLSVYLQQNATRAEFRITQAIRMDATTTEAFTYRAGELSTLLQPLDDPGNSFLILMCSTRQPDEPDRIFPARFVLALELVTGE